MNRTAADVLFFEHCRVADRLADCYNAVGGKKDDKLFICRNGRLYWICVQISSGTSAHRNQSGISCKNIDHQCDRSICDRDHRSCSCKNTALNPKLVLFLKAGICGGFTTFSTFAYETGTMMEKGQTGLALLYVILSAVLGVLAVFGGQLLVR